MNSQQVPLWSDRHDTQLLQPHNAYRHKHGMFYRLSDNLGKAIAMISLAPS